MGYNKFSKLKEPALEHTMFLKEPYNPKIKQLLEITRP